MVDIHGANLLAIKKAIITRYGNSSFEEFSKKLPSDQREALLNEDLTHKWFPLNTFTSILNVAENSFGNGLGKFIQEVGKIEADLLVNTMKLNGRNVLIRTPADVIKYAPVYIPPLIFEDGRGEFVSADDTGGTFRIGLPYLYTNPGLRMALQHLTVGGMIALLESKGCKNTRIQSVKLGEWEDKVPYIEITIKWSNKC